MLHATRRRSQGVSLQWQWKVVPGRALQSMEERADYLVVVPPIKGGAAVVPDRGPVTRR